MRVFRTVPQQDMQLYVQTAFVLPIAAFRFVNSPSLVLLKSNVKNALWKLRKKEQEGTKVSELGYA